MNIESYSKTLSHWELSGAIFMIIFGTLLHFFYNWSGGNNIVALFSPVNESVWEHLKLGFWSLLLFSAVEFIFVRENANNFLTAKAVGILVLELIIVVGFYFYTAVAGRSILFIDISLYFIGTIICQIISYRIMLKPEFTQNAFYISVLFIAVLMISFFIFTFYPPRLPIFKDHRSNSYGISEAIYYRY